MLYSESYGCPILRGRYFASVNLASRSGPVIVGQLGAGNQEAQAAMTMDCSLPAKAPIITSWRSR